MKRMQTWDGGEAAGGLKDFSFALRSLKADEYHLLGVAKPQEKLTWQKSLEAAQMALTRKRAEVFRPVVLGKPWTGASKPTSVTKFGQFVIFFFLPPSFFFLLAPSFFFLPSFVFRLFCFFFFWLF